MKKPFFILAFILILLFALAACDGNTSGGNGGNTGDTPGGDNTPHTHAYGEWETTKEASCLEEGTKERICSCGEKESETIPATGHTFGEWIVDKEPTKEEDGAKHTVCTACGEQVQEKIHATGSSGLAYTKNEDGKSCIIIGIGTCKDTDLFIPFMIDGYEVTSIGSHAFYNCESLTSITIPSSVTSIGSYAFSDCESLTSITVENGNTRYHSAGNCLIEKTSKTLIAGCKNSVIPTDGSVTSIGSRAFADCESLTNITIPSSVTSIGDYAFLGCSSLTSITVEKGNTVYHSAGNCLIETKSKTLIAGCKNSVISTDGSVTRIGEDAFSHCYSLTSITIPSSVTSIGSDAFYYCESLTSITFGENSKLTSIGKYAFYNCSSFTSISIPSSVTSIGKYAFYECDSLTSITFGGTKAQWENVSKGNNWNDETPTITVTCTDGVYPTTY